MPEPRIVVVGSSNTDMTVLSPHLPAPGETVIGGTFLRAGGGKGANQAVAAARAGASVTFVGRVGDDTLGRDAVAALQAEGVDTTWVVVDTSAPSGVALILVDENGENMISVASGANARLSAEDVMKAAGAFDSAHAVLVQLEIPLAAVGAALKLGRRAAATTILDPAPAPKGGLARDLLENVAALTPNRTEAAQLLGRAASEPPERLAAGLMELGVGAVALTLGAEGVVVCQGAGCTRVPAAAVKAVDTVGAGDCFAAVLGVGMAEGMNFVEAAQFAVCAAALSCQRKGAQPSLPERDEIERKHGEVSGNL